MPAYTKAFNRVNFFAAPTVFELHVRGDELSETDTKNARLSRNVDQYFFPNIPPMKHFFVIALSLAFAFATISCNNADKTKTEKTTASVYTCPMHPEITSDKPGNCPKCGMELVPQEEAATADTSHAR